MPIMSSSPSKGTVHRIEPETIRNLLEWDLAQDRLDEAAQLIRSTFSSRHYQSGKLLPLQKTIFAILRRADELGRRDEAISLLEFLAKHDEAGTVIWSRHLNDVPGRH